MSLLTPYIKTTEHRENFSRPPPDLIDNDEQYKVETIRSHQHQGRKRQLQYLVKWMGYPKSDNMWEPVENIQAPLLIKQYHQQHPLEAIKASLMQTILHQSNWITNAPNSILNPRSLLFPTLTSHPSSALTYTQPTSSPSFNQASKGTSRTNTTPNIPTTATNTTAPHTAKCLSTYPTSLQPPLTNHPSQAETKTSQDSSPSLKNTYPPSPKLPWPTYHTQSLTLKMNLHPFTSLLPPKKLSKNSPQSPHAPLKCYYKCTPISTTPSMQSPSDSSPPYTATPWPPARNLTNPKPMSNNYKAKSQLITWRSPGSKDDWEQSTYPQDSSQTWATYQAQYPSAWGNKLSCGSLEG